MKLRFVLVIIILFGLSALTVYATDQDYDNGMPVYKVNRFEYYINTSDVNSLYKVNLDNNYEEKIFSKSVSCMVKSGSLLYLVTYYNKNSELYRLNVTDNKYELLISNISGEISSISIRNNELFMSVLGKGIITYNVNTSELLEKLICKDISYLYFININEIKYYYSDGVKICKCIDGEFESGAEISEATVLSINSSKTVSKYYPRLSAPSSDNLYYKHVNYGGLNECIHISDGSVLPNCVGYAWGRAYEILRRKPLLCKGNAGSWYSYNKNKSYYSFGTTPRLGAIAVWSKNGTQTSGHVAVVENIDGDKILTSESAYNSFKFKIRLRNLDINLSASNLYKFAGFIYILGNSNEQNHIHNYILKYENEHPHKEYYLCSCGDKYYTEKAGCKLWYENEHPHKEYYECAVENCKLNHTYTGINKMSKGYEAEHPHKEYYKCDYEKCSYNYTYSGINKIAKGYEAEHPHHEYCECCVLECEHNHSYTGSDGVFFWYESEYPCKEYCECIIAGCKLNHSYNGKTKK